MRKWGKDRRKASHIRRMNPKNIRLVWRNSGNRGFQESREWGTGVGDEWGGGYWRICRCAAQVGHWDMQEGGAQRLTWKTGKGREQGTAVHQEDCSLGSPRRGVVERWHGLGSAESRCKRPGGNLVKETGSKLQERTGRHAKDWQRLASQQRQ